MNKGARDKILIIILTGAALGGGFYVSQKIYYDNKFLRGLAYQATKSNVQNQKNLSPSNLAKLTFYVESQDLKFAPPKEITALWTEKYYRLYTQKEETRLSAQNISAYFKSIESRVNKDPIDARLEFTDNRVSAFSLPQKGQYLDIGQSINRAFKNLKSGQYEVALALRAAEPNITLDKINNLGITALLARGESDFSGSTNSRVHNIKVGSVLFNGILLKPGEEFSFNSNLGEVTAETGYLSELVIKNGKLIPEYGGGICQISTTVFRAAVLSGLPISERRPHSFPVRYYNPQGFDATIYPGITDLKFKNDTPGHLLIQTRVEKNNLFVEIYGSPDNRKVEISGPKQYDIKPDGSLKALLTRTVTMGSGEKKEDRFYSFYKSPSAFPLERNPLE